MSATRQQQQQQPAAAVAPPEEQPISRVPRAEVRCGACDEVVVSIARTPAAEAILHVYERQVLRPHTLTDEDLPLNWRCPKCGAAIIIGETIGAE